jgi:hypothetical protein
LLRWIIIDELRDIVEALAGIPAFLCSALSKSMGFPFVTTAHAIFETGGGLKYLSRWGLKTLAISDDIRDYLIRDYNVSPGNITVTVNGIDTRNLPRGCRRYTGSRAGSWRAPRHRLRQPHGSGRLPRRVGSWSVIAAICREIPGIRILAVGAAQSEAAA